MTQTSRVLYTILWKKFIMFKYMKPNLLYSSYLDFVHVSKTSIGFIMYRANLSRPISHSWRSRSHWGITSRLVLYEIHHYSYETAKSIRVSSPCVRRPDSPQVYDREDKEWEHYTRNGRAGFLHCHCNSGNGSEPVTCQSIIFIFCYHLLEYWGSGKIGNIVYR